MKKILTFSILLLFILMTVSSTVEASTSNDDVEIKITAGHYGLDIGTCLTIDVTINTNETITIFYNFTSDYVFTNLRDGTNTIKSTYEEKGNYSSFYFKYFLGFGIDLFSITVKCEDISVTRNGIWIGVRLCILFK